jgi:hypothetical protein
MGDNSEPLDDMEECQCGTCKGLFWVPYYEMLPELGHPSFCAFCGSSFEFTINMDEEGLDEEGH